MISNNGVGDKPMSIFEIVYNAARAEKMNHVYAAGLCIIMLSNEATLSRISRRSTIISTAP